MHWPLDALILHISDQEGEIVKRRFGISIPEDLLDKLDSLSRELMVDRSSLIREMIEESIEGRSHLLTPHECTGILLVVSRGSEDAGRILEKYCRCIISRSHHHSEDCCVDISFVRAKSEEILKLERELRRIKGVSERYIPLSCVK
jgi:CopG family nickel-responsive transcriptional regulator